MSWSRRLLIVFAAVLAGCGGPTAPSPVATGLAIVPSEDLLTIKASLTFTVVGTFADGNSRAVEAKWVTDNPAVATVSAGGTAVGVGAGSMTLIAIAEGQTVSRVVRVVPDFRGAWSGQAQVTGCSAGDFRTCGRSYPTGQIHAIAATLSQTRDTVAGTVQFDAPGTATSPMYIGSVSGPIQLAGSLVLQGTLTRQLPNGDVSVGPTLFDWSTPLDTTGIYMTGHFTQITDAGLFFPTRVSYSLVMTKAGR